MFEWFEKLELVCRFRGVMDLKTVILLKLTGSLFISTFPMNARKFQNL